LRNIKVIDLAGQQDDTLNVQPTLINRFAGNDIG